MGGRSSRTFREEGRLADIESQLKPGDYLVVQFGHNDANPDKPERYVAAADFGASLRPYLEAARSRGARLVLVSPIAMREFDETGRCPAPFAAHRDAMAAFARENGVPFLDLGAETAAANTAAGPLRTTTWYRQLPDGSQDNAHLQSAGALRFARAFVAALHKNTDPRLDLLRAVFPL